MPSLAPTPRYASHSSYEFVPPFPFSNPTYMLLRVGWGLDTHLLILLPSPHTWFFVSNSKIHKTKILSLKQNVHWHFWPSQDAHPHCRNIYQTNICYKYIQSHEVSDVSVLHHQVQPPWPRVTYNRNLTLPLLKICP